MTQSVTKPSWTFSRKFPTEDTPEFQLDMRTVGLNNYGLPELALVLNIPQSNAQELLTELATCQLEGYIFNKSKVYYDILEGVPVQTVATTTAGIPTTFFILPDSAGRLPHEKSCEYPFNKQIEFLENIRRLYDDK